MSVKGVRGRVTSTDGLEAQNPPTALVAVTVIVYGAS